MANIDRPNGFRASKTLNGSPMAGMLRKLTVAAITDATANHGDIYIGDVVKMSLAGVVTPADSGEIIYGVVAGVGVDNIEHGDTGMFDADNLEKRYLPHANAGFVWVYPKENMLFEIQTDGALTLTVGELSDHNMTTVTAHGERDSGVSTLELVDGSNNDVTVVELVTRPDNDNTLTNARVLVSIN